MYLRALLGALAAFMLMTSHVPASIIIIENVSVADPSRDGILTGQSIVISNGVIMWMGDAADLSMAVDDVTIIPGEGKFVIPGLMDMHVHVGDLSETYNTLQVVNGVTRVRGMGGDIWRISDIRSRIEGGDLVGPEMTACGPILENRRWLTKVRTIITKTLYHRIPVETSSEARDVIEMIAPLDLDFIKVRNAPAPPAFAELVRAAGENGLSVVGHEPMVVSLREAIEIGQRSIEHVPWMSLTLPGRNPTSDDIDALCRTAVEQNVYMTPTIIAMQGRLQTTDELRQRLETGEPLMRYISESHIARWRDGLDGRDKENNTLDWGTMIETSIGYLQQMHRAGVPIMTGTDVGPIFIYPGWSLHRELQMLVEQVGLTPREALQCATLRPAQFLGIEDEEGTIAAGMLANLVVLDANPFEDIANTQRISAVVLRGELLDAERIDSLKQWAEANKDVEQDYEHTEVTLRNQCEQSPTADAAALLGSFYFAKGDYAEARRYGELARELGDDSTALARGLFTIKCNELYEGGEDADCTILHDDLDRLLAEADGDEIVAIVDRVRRVALAHGGEDTLTRYLPSVAELDAGALADSSRFFYHECMIEFSLRVAHDEDGALDHRKQQFPAGWEESGRQLNRLAWWCFERRIALDAARELGEAAVAKSDNDRTKAYALDTLAEIVNALGDPAKAAALLEEAFALEPTEQFETQLKRFRVLAGG